MNSLENIFISICSYRDSDIYNTIHSLLDNSHNYKNLFIFVYVQEIYSNNLKHYFFIKRKYHKNVVFHSTYYKNAKGPLFARQYIINYLKKQNKNKFKYYFQIDSHMRFISDWDLILITNYKNLYPEKKIISYYPMKNFNEKNNIPVLIEKSKINNDLIDKYKTRFINSNIIKQYFSSKYIAAGFFFTEITNILKYYPLIEIPYLFQGEEMLLTFIFKKKNNFIIFSPSTNIAIHNYNRKNEHKIWNDISNWKSLNNNAILKLLKLIH